MVSAVRWEVKMAMRPNCERWARIAFRMKLPMVPVAPKRRMFWGDMVVEYTVEEYYPGKRDKRARRIIVNFVRFLG